MTAKKKKKSRKDDENHAGRFQAQGDMKTLGERWGKNEPLPYIEGKLLLNTLKNKITSQQFEERKFGFSLCFAAIKKMNENGGFSYPGIWKQSYPPAKRKRVDLDIFKGMAFV